MTSCPAPWSPPASRCARCSRARGSDPVGAFVRALTQRPSRARCPSSRSRSHSNASTARRLWSPSPSLPVHAQYSRAQAATGLQSFDDQIWFAVADMLADPAHRAFIQGRFDHVLVDEFQDLNGAQLALVDVLSRPHRRLFVVGDDDQLIYGWRQADPRGILEFHSRMPPRPFSATYTLCTNYRCSRAVVETGARLVANNRVREAKDIRPRAGAQDGAVRFVGAASWPERAAAMCAFLRRGEGAAWPATGATSPCCAGTGRSSSWSRSPWMPPASRARRRSAAPLFTHPAAVLLRAYLDLVRAPDDAARAGARGPVEPAQPVRRPPPSSRRSQDRREPWATVRTAAAREPAAGPRPLSGLRRAGRRSCRASSPARLTSEELVWAVVETFGLDGLLGRGGRRRRGGRSPDGAGPLEVFDSLLLLAETYPDPDRYLATWDRLRADEEAHADTADDTLAREEAEEDRVVIGTIHAAKGREYHSVVIPDYDCDVSRWEPARDRRGASRRLRGRHPRARRRRCSPSTRRRASSTRSSASWWSRPSRRSTSRSRPGSTRSRDAALRRARRRPPRGDRGALPRTRAGSAAARRGGAHPGRVPAAASAHRSHSRGDGSGGATKCFADGSVPGFKKRCMSSCSSRSVTVRRWCCRTCSSQLDSTKVSM